MRIGREEGSQVKKDPEITACRKSQGLDFDDDVVISR